MPGDQILFLVVAIVLIIAWTAYNIWTVRRSTKLMRDLEKLQGESREE